MRVLVWICFSFAAATALGVYGGVGSWLTAAGAACLMVSVGMAFLHRFRVCRVAALVCLGLGLGALYTNLYAARNLSPVQALAGTVQTLSVQVVEPPEQGAAGVCVIGETCVADTQCRVLVYLHESPELDPGDEISLTVQIAVQNPKQPSIWERNNLAKGILLVCYQRGSVTRLPASGADVRLLPQRVAQRCRQMIDELFSGDAAKLIRALLTGDRSCLSDQVSSDFARSGLSHAIAVSGMHVSVLLTLIFGLFGRRRPAMTLPWLLLPFFAAMVGFSPSAMRAVVMQLVLLLAFWLRREYDLPTALGFALLLALLQNPWVIASVSLQMSYLAVVGIHLLSQPCYRRLCGNPKREAWLKRHRLLRRLYRSAALTVSTTLGALVFTVPLTAVYFGTVSLVPVLTNLLTLFAVSLCFCGALLAVLFGFVWKPLGAILAPIAACLARYILLVARTAAAWPYAAMDAGNGYLLAWLVFAYGVLAVSALGRIKRLTVPLCAVAMGLMLSVLLSALDVPVRTGGVTAVDVGQGQCIVIELSQCVCMVDCGGSRDDEAGEMAARFLEQNNLPGVDLLILTHYDIDHVGGVEQLLHRTQMGQILLPDVPDSEGIRQRIEALAQEHRIPVLYVTNDMTISSGTERLRVFAPMSSRSDNAASLCVLAEGTGFTALVTGDLDISTEYTLLRKLTDVDLDIFVAGHHGSKTSTSGALLERLRPEFVLISVGDNSYGHPAPEVLARIEAAGAAVYRTDQCGTISIFQNEE